MQLFKVVLALALLLSAEGAPKPPEAEEVDDKVGHTAEEMDEAKEEFDSIDTNKDGFVTREVCHCSQDHLPSPRHSPAPHTNTENLFQKHPPTLPPPLPQEILEMEEVPEQEEMDEFFETYDTNKDQKVTFDEIVAADELLRDEAKSDGADEETEAQ